MSCIGALRRAMGTSWRIVAGSYVGFVGYRGATYHAAAEDNEDDEEDDVGAADVLTRVHRPRWLLSAETAKTDTTRIRAPGLTLTNRHSPMAKQ